MIRVLNFFYLFRNPSRLNNDKTVIYKLMVKQPLPPQTIAL